MFNTETKALSRSEGMGVRIMSFSMADEARHVYESQVSLATISRNLFMEKYVALRFARITLTILDGWRVARSNGCFGACKSREREYETQLAQRITKSARVCRYVFAPTKIVNGNVRGLKKEILKGNRTTLAPASIP